MEEEEALSNDESHAMQEVLTSLIQKYQNTLSRSQKITREEGLRDQSSEWRKDENSKETCTGNMREVYQ